MKTVYFVRHGESEGNVSEYRLGSDIGLTAKGKKQAKAIAERAANISFARIITSTMARAIETGAAIAERTQKPVEASDLFVERHLPSSVRGKRKDDPEVVQIDNVIHAEFSNPDFRHSDEETFLDIKERTLKALQFLIDLPENEILVVSHEHFLRMTAAAAIVGTDLDAKTGNAFMESLRMDNSGIMELQYDDSGEKPAWRLLVWNDKAHLG